MKYTPNLVRSSRERWLIHHPSYCKHILFTNIPLIQPANLNLIIIICWMTLDTSITRMHKKALFISVHCNAEKEVLPPFNEEQV